MLPYLLLLSDMEALFLFVAILLSMGISLGVGASTMAVLSFFVAIKDGKIDPTERSFMGITYIVLRIAMVVILLSAGTMAYLGAAEMGASYFSNYVIAQFTLIGVLYINAILMTLRVMPSTFGPAIQASSWYTLGLLMAFYNQGVTDFTMTTFCLAYLAMFILALMIINGAMNYLKSKREEQPVATK